MQSATINEMMAGSAESDRVESTYSGQFVSYEVIERSAESNLHEIHMADELGVL